MKKKILKDIFWLVVCFVVLGWAMIFIHEYSHLITLQFLGGKGHIVFLYGGFLGYAKPTLLPTDIYGTQIVAFAGGFAVFVVYTLLWILFKKLGITIPQIPLSIYGIVSLFYASGETLYYPTGNMLYHLTLSVIGIPLCVLIIIRPLAKVLGINL